jgi:citrate synthase
VTEPLCELSGDDIRVRGFDVARELVGTYSFTEMLLLELRGTPAAPEHVRVVDAVLVSVMEHGLTPSALATRLVLDAAPESIPGAIAAGLLGTGTRFLGAMEQAAELLQDAQVRGADEAVRSVLDAGGRLAGFGHNLHAAIDPRVDALLAVAQREGTAGSACAAHRKLVAAVRHARPELIPNAAGAIAAVLLDLGFEPRLTPGFALVARCAGLLAHVADEAAQPRARAIWEANA